MHPDEALVQVVSRDFANAAHPRTIMKTLKVFYVCGLTMAGESPNDLPIEKVFPRSIRCVDAYKKSCPELYKTQGALVMRREFLEEESRQVFHNTILHISKNAAAFWRLSSEQRARRTRMTATGPRRISPINIRIVWQWRTLAFQWFAAVTGVRSGQFSINNKNKKVHKPSLGGWVHYWLRLCCYDSIRSKPLISVRKKFLNLIGQKSTASEIYNIIQPSDIRRVTVDLPGFRDTKFAIYDADFWLMILHGGSPFDPPFDWMTNLYRSAESNKLGRVAIFPKEYAPCFTIPLMVAEGADAETIEKYTQPVTYSSALNNNYELLNKSYRNNKKSPCFAKVQEYLSLARSSGRRLTKAAGAFPGFSLHSLRKLCAWSFLEHISRTGFTELSAEEMRQKMRWTQLPQLKQLYTVSDGLRAAELQKDNDRVATLHQRFMQIATLLVNAVEHGDESPEKTVDENGVHSLCEIIANTRL